MKKLKEGEFQIDFEVRIMYRKEDFKKSETKKEINDIKNEFNKLLKKRKYKI